MLVKFVKKIRNKIYYFKESKYYYGEFKGTLNFWKLILFNLCYPGRFFNQFKYGQIKYINYLKNKFSKNNLSNASLQDKFYDLNQNGSVTIKSFFSKEMIDNFKKDYLDEINNLKSKDTNNNEYFKDIALRLKSNLISLWLNKDLIELIEKYMCAKLYARNYPTLNYSVGKFETSSRSIHEIKNTNVTDVWHVDHSTLISIHVFLEDVKKDGTFEPALLEDMYPYLSKKEIDNALK